MQRLLAKRRRDLALADQLQVDRQGADLQQLGDVLRLAQREAADLGAVAPVDPVRVLLEVDDRPRVDLVVEDDREVARRLVDGDSRAGQVVGGGGLGDVAGDVLELLAALVCEAEGDVRLLGLGVVLLLGVLDVGPGERWAVPDRVPARGGIGEGLAGVGVGGLLGDHEGAFGHPDHDSVAGALAAGRADEEIAALGLRSGDQLVRRLAGEEVEAVGQRARLAIRLRRLLGGDQRGVVGGRFGAGCDQLLVEWVVGIAPRLLPRVL
jgi:hypothetical protein